MIPSPDLTLRILREISLVRAFKPWLPEIGVVGDPAVGSLFYQWNVASQTPSIIAPLYLDVDDPTLRRLIRHEMGHCWVDALSRRIGNSYDIYPDLGIDGAHPQRGEIAAEIFARVMGESPSYPNLEPLSQPTTGRIAFVERSGAMANHDAEKAQLGIDIAAFWRRADIAQWFRDYAPNIQRYIDLYLQRQP